jgi:DNA-binding CsgD family transcriptional regulator
MISTWIPSGRDTVPGAHALLELSCAMGSERFADALLGCLAPWVRSQHFNVLRMDGRQPSLLLAGSRYSDPLLVWRCWQVYARRFHGHDELLQQMRRQTGGETQIGHLLAEDIAFQPYRQAIYLDNGMSERLCGQFPDSHGDTLLINLYRHREDGCFSDREIRAFEQFGPALAQLLRGHLALQRERRGSETWRSTLLAHASDLTEQEQAVCLCLLRGMSHAGTAAELGIKETTVKTYRNRAFQRLGIHFRSQLFTLIVSA